MRHFLHLSRSRHNPGSDVVGLLMSFYKLSHRTDIFDASICTRPHKDVIYHFPFHRFTWDKAHVIERFQVRSFIGTFHSLGAWNGPGHFDSHPWIGSIGDHRFDVCRFKNQFFVKNGPIVCFQGFPMCYRLIPIRPFGSILFSLQVGKGGFIWGNKPPTCAHLDGHVANRHSSFHG